MSEGNIFGASMVQRNESPIGFHFDGEPVEKDWSPQSTESVWWLPRASASDYLILANASTQPLAASLVVSGAAGGRYQQAVNLGPAETQRLDLRAITEAGHLTATEGGVTVLVPTGGGNLITSHIAFDETTGMSATMKAFERDPAEKPKAHTMRAPMMALVNPDAVLQFPAGTRLIPQVFLRNTTAAPLKVGASLSWRSAGQSGSVPLPEITLAPGATRVVSLADTAVPPSAYWATIVLNYQGRRADLVPIAASFDETGRYGLQTPFSEGVSHLWKGSMWHVDASHNSLITAANGGTGPTHAAVTLFYNQGKGSYTIEKQLEPGEQIWANLGDIIRGQIPDKNGKTIPPDTMMGSYELRDLDHIGVGYLYEGKLVINKAWGHGYYGCAGCCGYEGQRLLPNPFSRGVGTQGNNTAESEDMCSDSWVDLTSEAYDWASTNSGIVNLPNATSHFMSPGTVTGSTQIQLQRQLARLECPVQGFEPQNTQDALEVQITSADITQDNITVVLSGPSGTSGNLIVQVTGADGGSPIDPIENATLGPGTYNYNFGLSSIPIGEYTTVTATWTVNGEATTASIGYTFQVMGTYVQTQYKTPYEGNCGGGPTGVTLWVASPKCASSSGSLLSNFINAVAAPGSGTGSGQSINYHGVVPEQYCTGLFDDELSAERHNNRYVGAT